MRIRHSFLFIAVLSSILLTGLTSCGDIEQNLKLNADGSGTLETSFDIGEMMSMIQGMGDMGDLEDMNENDDVEDEDINLSENQPVDTAQAMPEEGKDPMELLMEKITNPEYDRDFDSLISFVSLMPDSVKQKETRMDLVNKINLRLRSPAKSSSLIMGIVMNFDNEAQLDELVKYMETMDNTSTTGMMPSVGGGGMQAENFLVFDADMKAGWIRFDTVDYSALAPELGMSSDSLMSSEDMGMMEMMFGNTKLKSVIEVPGEVLSCTNKDAILTKDNKVIVEYGFMEVVKKGKMPGYTIYFTPKK